MWLATRGGFLSAVEAPRGGIVVRSRERRALEHLMEHVDGRAKIVKTPGRDYLFRVFLDRDQFAAAVARMARGIDYGNFKSQVLAETRAGRVSTAYERALHTVWSVLGRTQEGGPYGWHRPKRRKRRRGADRTLRDDLGVRELDLGEYGTWPEEASVADIADALDPAGAASLGEEYE